MSDQFNIYLNTTTNASAAVAPWTVEVGADFGLVLPALYFLVVGSLRVCSLNRNTRSLFISDKALRMAKQRRFGVKFWRYKLKLIGSVCSLGTFLLRGGVTLGLCFVKDDVEIQQLLSNPDTAYTWAAAQLSLCLFNIAAWSFAIYVTTREFRCLKSNGWELRSFWISSAIFSMVQIVIFAFGEPDEDHNKIYNYNMFINFTLYFSLVPLTLMAGLAMFPRDITVTAYQLMLEAVEAADQSYYLMGDQDVLDSMDNDADPHSGGAGHKRDSGSVVEQLYEKQQKRYSNSTSAHSRNKSAGVMFYQLDDSSDTDNDTGYRRDKEKSVWTGDDDDDAPPPGYNRQKTISATSTNSVATNLLAEELVDTLIRDSNISPMHHSTSRPPSLSGSRPPSLSGTSLPRSGHVGKINPSLWDEASDHVRSRMEQTLRNTMAETGMDIAGAQQHLQDTEQQHFHTVGSLEDEYAGRLHPGASELRSPISQSLPEHGSKLHPNAAAPPIKHADSDGVSNSIVPDDADVQVTIDGFNWNGKKKCVVYNVVVRVGAPVHRTWHFAKRYRQFLKFDQTLQATYPPKCIPPFPGKQKTNPQTRCQKLKKYLQTLMMNLGSDALIKPLPATVCVKHPTKYHSIPFLDLREVGV